MTDQPGPTVALAAQRLGLSVRVGGESLATPIAGAQVSDLLSHVMAEGRQGQLWVTVQTHSNIVAVAALAGLSGIILASGFMPGDDTIARARDEGIPLMTTPESAYTIAGKLYEMGVR